MQEKAQKPRSTRLKRVSPLISSPEMSIRVKMIKMAANPFFSFLRIFFQLKGREGATKFLKEGMKGGTFSAHEV